MVLNNRLKLGLIIMKVVKIQGYKQANSDHTLFHRHFNGKINILSVYLDDMILTEDDKDEKERLKSVLNAEFEVKEL